MSDEYRKVLVCPPNPATSAIQDQDLVVINHEDGQWSVMKDRYGPTTRPRPYDDLPSRVKRAIRP